MGYMIKKILQNIDNLGQSMLEVIEDKKLKDLLSKLLVKEPEIEYLGKIILSMTFLDILKLL